LLLFSFFVDFNGLFLFSFFESKFGDDNGLKYKDEEDEVDDGEILERVLIF
jgi:hypothetical protein